MPFPLPRFVFLTLAEKWNRHSPVHLGEEIAQVLAERVLLSRYNLKTHMLDFGRYRQIGFTGRCEFRIEAENGDLWGRVPHLLADFAFYAGVGYKTTMGMGQVQRV
jgi:CRISPR-associated endoribonuclease Cas6